ARHEARLLADADTMTEEELAKAEAKLAHHNKIAQARLSRAAAQLEKKTGAVIDDDVVEATAEALSTIELTDSVTPRGDKSNKGNKGHSGKSGEKSNNGKNGTNGNRGNSGNKGNPNR